MNVSLIATADGNLFATTLAARLIHRGIVPRCIVCAEQPRLHRFVAHLRVAGVGPTLRKLLRHYDLAGLPDRDARYYLGRYAAEHGLAGWDGTLSALSRQHGIAFCRCDTVHSDAAVECVRRHDIDLLINTAGVIFKPPLLQAPKVGMLNAHMGRLPTFRGMNVLEWSLWCDAPVGITVHFVQPGIDTGDLLEFRPIPIEPDDTVAALRSKSYAVGIEALVDCVVALSEGRAVRTPQDLAEGRQYFAMHPRLLAIVEEKLRKRQRACDAVMPGRDRAGPV